MALRKRPLQWIGVLLAYGVIVALPAHFPESLAGALVESAKAKVSERVDGVWPPETVEVDRRLLRAGVAFCGLVLLGFALRAGWRRRALVRAQTDVERLRDEYGRLAERWDSWIEPRYPLSLRYAAPGGPVEIEDRTGAFPELDPQRWVDAALEERLEPEYRGRLRAWVQRALAGDPPPEPFEALVHGVAPDLRWIEFLLRLERDGGAPWVDAIGRDVTERREEELERALRTAIEGEWLRSVSFDSSLVTVLRALAEGLACQYAELWWLEDRYDLLQPGPCWHAGGPELDGFARSARNQSFGKGVGLAGRVWAEGAPVRLDDLAREIDPRCARIADRGPFGSALGLPVRNGDRVLGVAVLLSRSSPMAPVTPERLDRLGHQLGRFVARKRGERAVQGSEARKNAMLDSALDCVITIDHEGRVVEFNPAAEKTFGRARTDVLGRRMVDLLVPDELRRQHMEAFERCLGPGAERPAGRRLELEALHADGHRFPVEVSVTSIHVGDTPSFTAYLRDITERKELDRLKDELVSTVSHELRTPLTSMRGFVELMLERELSPEDQRRFLEIVDTEIKRLGKLIDDFLDLQRLEAGKLDYEFAPASLRPLIEEAVEMFAHTSETHRYAIDVPDDEIPVHVDVDRIRQTLRNLLSNATKYSPDGGCVTVMAACEDGRVRVAVRDEGIGMDEATQTKLFTRFYRADATATRRIGGTGLGLALVKEIVEAHDGEVGVRSTPGEGSEFYFTLPLGEAKPD